MTKPEAFLQNLFTGKIGDLFVLLGSWLALFVLYLPAVYAGRVGDFPGWVHFLNSVPFPDYVNRKGSQIASMYQFTQVLTYGFYKLFGASAWAWHLLFISLQAVNAWLLFRFFRNLYKPLNFKNTSLAAAAGVFLFCLSPCISEVIVSKPSFHYLLGLLLMLCILLSVQQYLATPKSRFAFTAGILFFVSTFSLEVFYLTPLFTLTLAYFTVHEKTRRLQFLRSIALPQAIIFLIHFFLIHALYHALVAHSGSLPIDFSPAVILSKPTKYLFHLLLLGRFMDNGIRTLVYKALSSWAAIGLCYLTFAVIAAFFALRWRKIDDYGRTIALLLTWAACSLALISPLWFPTSGQVIFDRYLYISVALIAMLLALLAARLRPLYLYLFLVVAYGLLLARFTHKTNKWWQQSAHIVNNLVNTFPNDTSKTVLLLDIPECYDGVQMIGTHDEGEFKMLYEAITNHNVPNPVYDVVGFYMVNIYSGAHVIVINDTTARISLDQWGSYWTYLGKGAFSYENAEYRVDMRDLGRWYYLTIKRSPDHYLMLFNNGDHWSSVKWNKRNVDQY